MFRALRLRSHPVSAVQLSASVFALLLLVTVDGAIPAPAEASVASRQMAAVRRSQERAEKRMRAADLRINALKRARRAGPKRAKQAIRRFERLKQRRAAARVRRSALADRASQARLDLDRRVRARPDPMGRQRAPKAKVRKRVKALNKKVARQERKVRKLERKTLRAGKQKRDRTASRREIRSRITRQVARREAAEAVLGSDIKQMVALAKQKAAARSRARPARSGFSWPARGTVSQGYGCTHRKKVNGRTKCVQTHDGIDIATRRGATVRASATGVVAYVGWNPWDTGKRAFVVIIGHAGGFETIYGHLQPRRRVKAGQLVRKGQKIGFAGSTGRSTGPHVHWEVSRNFVTRDPRSRR